MCFIFRRILDEHLYCSCLISLAWWNERLCVSLFLLVLVLHWKRNDPGYLLWTKLFILCPSFMNKFLEYALVMLNFWKAGWCSINRGKNPKFIPCFDLLRIKLWLHSFIHILEYFPAISTWIVAGLMSIIVFSFSQFCWYAWNGETANSLASTLDFPSSVWGLRLISFFFIPEVKGWLDDSY